MRRFCAIERPVGNADVWCTKRGGPSGRRGQRQHGFAELGIPFFEESKAAMQGGERFAGGWRWPRGIEGVEFIEGAGAGRIECGAGGGGGGADIGILASEERTGERGRGGGPAGGEGEDRLACGGHDWEEIGEIRRDGRGAGEGGRFFEREEMAQAWDGIAQDRESGVEFGEGGGVARRRIGMLRGGPAMEGVAQRGLVEPGTAGLVEQCEIVGHLRNVGDPAPPAQARARLSASSRGMAALRSGHEFCRASVATPRRVDQPVNAAPPRIPVLSLRAPLLALALASTLCGALLVVRVAYSRHVGFPSFLWNLFLAWIPLWLAIALHGRRQRGADGWWIDAGCGLLWFLFFPNAPYIVTDFVHLHPRPGVPYWYDIIGVMAFALTGLFLGYLSLYLVQEVVRGWVGRWGSWVFALIMLALSSFGIYLGRFIRWNSWDALLDPLDRLASAAHIANPVSNPQALAFSATFFAFALVCYLIVYSFTHLHGPEQP
jgi:uncharacterized membrane protein